MEGNIKSNQAYNTSEPPVTPSKFDRATFVAEKIKLGAKRLVGQDNDSLGDSDDEQNLFEDAAFNPQKVLDGSPYDQSSLRDKLHRGAHGLAVAVKNPRRALRSKYVRNVAGNLSGGPGSYEKRYDAELVDAHDTLRAAVDGIDSDDAGTARWDRPKHRLGRHGSGESNISVYFSDKDDREAISTPGEIEEAKARVRKVEDQRDSLRTAWILGRHVKRIRIARPIEHRPLKSEFRTDPSNQQKGSIQWDRYLAQLALWHTRSFTPYHIDDFDELPFDMKDLSLTFERLAVVSAPWQNFLIELRSVYLWTDPKRTAKYLASYLVLWYFQHIITAAFVWIIVSTVRNRYNPTRIETIRARVQRAQDDQARAQAWGELIQRHGQENWVEPFLDEMGPLIQLELTDLSNLLEMVQSFYRWERPRATLRTLFFFSTCLLLSLIADMRLCVKLIWLGIGFIFFFSFPMSARHPKYRRLFNPLYWIFWDIPNLAEIAFTQLQAKAILRDAARLKRAEQPVDSTEDFSSSEEDTNSALNDANFPGHKSSSFDILRAIQEQDHITFRAVDSKRRIHGRLRIQRHGLWYYNKEVKSYYPYHRLSEIRKVELGNANDQDTSKMARIARRVEESTSLQFLPSGIEFIFLPSEPPTSGTKDDSRDSERLFLDKVQLALTVSESDRDKIFSLVISWSNLRWQPQFTLNKRNRLSHDSDHPSKAGRGNKNLDKVIKSFVH